MTVTVPTDVDSTTWCQHQKHIFVLSISGKPVYCRYGKEDKLVNLFGIMQAITSFFQDDNDNLRSMVAGGHRFVFMCRGPLVLVSISQSGQTDTQVNTCSYIPLHTRPHHAHSWPFNWTTSTTRFWVCSPTHNSPSGLRKRQALTSAICYKARRSSSTTSSTWQTGIHPSFSMGWAVIVL